MLVGEMMGINFSFPCNQGLMAYKAFIFRFLRSILDSYKVICI